MSDSLSTVAFIRSSSKEAVAPLVSVIVTTRNHRRWLPECVCAVLDQDIEAEIELIVCDNASTDDTEQVMRSLLDTAQRGLTYIRLKSDLGPAGGRNVGLSYGRGQFIAFTDSDCRPAQSWLRAALAAFCGAKIGMVQGRTVAADRAPLFSHFIETTRIDGHFSTSNIVYRREALADRRFDPSLAYWEDVDLGWRVSVAGWQVAFAYEALVMHQVVPLDPIRWMLWPRRYANWPAKAARYPAFRRYLFLGVWVRRLHLLFDVALVGIILAPWKPLSLLLALPYGLSFGRARGIRGRFPAAKIAAYVGRDLVAFATLLTSSVRHRALVL